MSISVNKQPIVLMSVYMPHSGYADHHVEKVYRTITKMIEGEKGMKIIGGDFNAELGPGEGLELSAVGHYTLNKGNCRGEWMTQWLIQNKLVALNTMYKKVPQKQVTNCTSKDVGKQLDYIMSDRKHYKWSRDAEACDTIHMGSDHRCVAARFEIPNDKEKSKPRKTKAPSTEQNSERCDDEKQQKYLDLEQRVKEVDSKQITKESTSEAKDANAAAAMQEAKADETEGRKAAEASEASAAGEKILEKSQAAAPEGTAASEEQEKGENNENRSAKTTRQEKETEGKEGKITTDASAAPAAAAADEGSMRRHAAAPAGTAAPEATETNEKDERIRALIHERKTSGKHNKDRVREISKEIKKCIRENKRLRRQEKFKKSWIK